MFQKLNFNQSKTQANLRELWSAMKRQGRFKEYSDYDDYLTNRNKPIEKVKDQSLAILEAAETARIRGFKIK